MGLFTTPGLLPCPLFQASPPGALPYTALTFDGKSLVFRGGRPAAAADDVQQLASAAAADESPLSAAVEGVVVTQREAEAAVGGSEGDAEPGGSEGGRRIAALAPE